MYGGQEQERDQRMGTGVFGRLVMACLFGVIIFFVFFLLEDGFTDCLLDTTCGTSRDIKCHVHLYKGLVFAVSVIVTLFSKLYLY